MSKDSVEVDSEETEVEYIKSHHYLILIDHHADSIVSWTTQQEKDRKVNSSSGNEPH